MAPHTTRKHTTQHLPMLWGGGPTER